MNAPKGTPTSLNLSTLHRVFGGKSRTVNGRITATSLAGLRRCAKAGLFTVEGSDLVLTELGENALCGYAFDQGTYPYGSI